MISKVGASNANKTHEKQKICSGSNFRHGMTTVGLHVNSVRQSPHGDSLALRLVSRLSLGLGLGLGLGGSSLSL
eukprot:11143045-Heterocapsa_arctica.AAC.1